MRFRELTAPSRLLATHKVEQFDCGEPSLDDWLRRWALKNEENNASRTYVVCHGDEIVGYYCLANGGIDRIKAPKRMQRNMPDPIPVMVLGRLAVDQRYQGDGIGTELLRDATLRVLQASEIGGIKAILVDAISEDAKRFYVSKGFLESPIEPTTLCLLLDTARQILTE
jgi:GNAT superfamily N-acetyltransferase